MVTKGKPYSIEKKVCLLRQHYHQQQKHKALRISGTSGASLRSSHGKFPLHREETNLFRK